MSETSRNLNVRKCLSFCGDSVYRSFSRNIMKEFYNPQKERVVERKLGRKLEKSRNWYLSIAREFFTSRIKFYFPRQSTSSWNLVLAYGGKLSWLSTQIKDPKLSVSPRRRPKITIISFETNPFILNRTSLFPILVLFFVFILKLRHNTLILKQRTWQM